MHLSRFPRLRFAHLPTPLEPLDNLSEILGGPKIWIKRDDCTGLGMGGNKTRKLEFLMADALQHHADVIITQGAVQSNHVRQTAAIAAKLGLACHILLEDRVGSKDRDYLGNGNVLLDQIFDATIQTRPGGTDMAREMENYAQHLRDDGHVPYIIPGGGSNKIGALGYVDAAMELVQQANDRGLIVDYIVHATGSAGTQAGLVAGLHGLNSNIPVLGISVRERKKSQEDKVFQLAEETSSFVGTTHAVPRHHVVANDQYVGQGYGIPSEKTIQTIEMLARKESILLDPVYSGKGMAGLLDLIRGGQFKDCKNVVFLHTGGSTALFGYTSFLGNNKPLTT